MIPSPRQDWKALDLASPLISDPEPPAALETLAWAQYLSLAALSTPYPNAMKCFDGVTSGLAFRRMTQVVGPGCLGARYAVTRYGRGKYTMPNSKVSTSEGGLAIYSDAPSTISGAEGYLEIDKQEGSSAIVWSGTTPPGTNGDYAYLELPEALVPATYTVEVISACAFTIHIPSEGQTFDLETL